MRLIKFLTLILGIVAFAACGNETHEQEKPKKGKVTLIASNNSVEVNTPITFTVIAEDGTDITAKATIMDKTNNRFVIVPNPYTPTEDGEYIFFAYGDKFDSDAITVNVVPTIPALPTDAEPENTSFYHRILLVDHTGTACKYCPHMMKALKEVAEDKGGYHDKYYEALAHSYGTSDPAGSDAANGISSDFHISNYPTVTINFQNSIRILWEDAVAPIKSQIDMLWKAEGANAGIAATTSLATKCVVVNAEVKAAVTNDYHITAWLLQDGIDEPQVGATEDWMRIHNNAIRQRIKASSITGVDLGNIVAGNTVSTALTLDISKNNWGINTDKANFKVLIIVSEKNDKGKFEVANVAICKIDDSVTYEYLD